MQTRTGPDSERPTGLGFSQSGGRKLQDGVCEAERMVHEGNWRYVRDQETFGLAENRDFHKWLHRLVIGEAASELG